MKHISLLLLILCVIGCHHNQTKAPDSSGRVWLSPSNEYVDTARSSQLTQEADLDSIDWDAEVDITRDWYPENRIVHLFGEPTRQQVVKWRNLCDRDTLHSVDQLELSQFAYGIRHLTAFYDLNNLSISDSEESEFILWRLTQFTGDSIMPVSVQARLEMFRQQINQLLEFDAQFQVERNMKAIMEAYLNHRYNRISIREIALQPSTLPLADNILYDYVLAMEYCGAYSSAFEAVNYPNGMASSYPVTYGESETNNAMIVRSAVNAWVYPDSSQLIGPDSRYATIPLVLAEYDAFIKGLEEDELELPVAQRREALLKEKAAWKKWMDFRIEIAPQLPEPYRSAFDHATRSICRRKLITLKNRYECFGYMSDDYFGTLLPFDCTDQELATYGQSAEGIIPDFSPYYYDPSWHILYSENGRVLLYFPRDSVATHFVIPSEVQAIGDNAFMCNQHLTELTLHNNIRKIAACSFHACAELRSITIKGPLTEIPWRAFDGCPKLETVDLPATIESIAGFAFARCTKLHILIVRSPDPPVFQMDNSEPGVTDFDWAFSDTRLSNCILYVPAASISKYQKAIGWNRFKHIQAI